MRNQSREDGRSSDDGRGSGACFSFFISKFWVGQEPGFWRSVSLNLCVELKVKREAGKMAQWLKYLPP